ncbi:MAG: hypothetical protein MZU95_17155 [Desulfomicrobium escambiense]|nr:hypothetical protein [Desulfomicrobium escambiense]
MAGEAGYPGGAGSRSRQHAGQATAALHGRRRRRPASCIGARAPVVLTSRADSASTWPASCAVAVLFAEAQRRGSAPGSQRVSAMDQGILVTGSVRPPSSLPSQSYINKIFAALFVRHTDGSQYSALSTACWISACPE